MSDRKARVLQIGYYPMLLQTRHMMLEQDGYEVFSALGNEQAKQIAAARSFDAIVIGFSGTLPDRQELLRWIKQNVERTPVVMLQAHTNDKFPEADVLALSEDPKVWLAAVRQATAK
jgi:DNA-binding response OmpR family regulator